MTLTIGQVPTADAGSDASICETETYALSGISSNQQSILWTTSGDGTFDDASSLTAVYTHGSGDVVTGIVTLTLTATEALPCVTNATDDMVLIINALPAAPTAVTASELLIYPGESSILSYTAGSGITFNWYASSCGGTLVGSGNNLTVSPIITTTYYGRWENLCGLSTCEEVTITVDYHNETIQISPASQMVSTAEVFTTEVELLQVTNLGAFDLEIDFDPLLLQANSVTLESFLTSTGRTSNELVNNIDNTTGLVNYSVNTNGSSDGPSGDGVLLTIEWTSTVSVPDDITTDLILQNIHITTPNATVIPSNIYNGEVTIIGAVTTKVISTITCPGSVIVPIEVTSFKDVTDFSINLDYIPAELSYASYQNVNTLLSGVSVTDNGTSLTMSYTGTTTTIPNGSTLLELEFIAPSNTVEVISSLAWDLSNSTYTDVNGDMDVSFDDGTVTIDPIPEDAGSITGLASVCQGLNGETYNIGAITHATSYTWDISPATAGIIIGSGTDITIDFSTTYSGNATLSVFGTNVCGDGVSSSLVIDVISYPTVNAGIDAIICEDVPYTLLATATDQQSILWTTSGDGTFDDATLLTATYTAGVNDITAGSVTISITAFAITPCASDATDDMEFTIQLKPTANAGADDVICEDVTYTLSGVVTNQQSVLWTTSGDGDFDDNTSLTAIYSPGINDITTGSAILTLTAEAIGPCGTDASDDMLLNIVSTPEINAGSDETICESETYYTLSGTASNQQSVFWTTSGDGAFDDDASLIAIYTPGTNDITTGIVTLSITAYAITPCANDAIDDMILTIVELPTSDAGADAGICEDPNYTLSGYASNYQSVLWTTSGDGTFDDDALLTAIYTPGISDITTGFTILTLTSEAITPCGTDASDDMTLAIGQAPTADAGDDNIICDNATYTLSGLVSNEQTLLWSTTGDGTFDDPTIVNATYTPGTNDITNGTVDLTITAFSIVPCTNNASDDMTLVIQNIPTVNAGVDDAICEGNTYSLSGSAQNYQSVLWTTSGDGNFDDNTSLTPIYTYGDNDIANGTVNLILTVDSPCGATAADDMILDIQSSVTTSAGDDASICVIDSYTLNGSANYQQSVLWTTTGDGTFDDTSITNATYTPGAIDITNGTVNLTITAFAIAPCAIDATDDMILAIIELPTADAGADAGICEDPNYTLSGNASNYQSVLWTTSGDGTFDDDASLIATYTPGTSDITTGYATLTLTSEAITPCGTDASDDMTLAIGQAPTADAGPDAIICDIESYTLNGTATYQQSVLWTTSGDGIFDDDASLTAIYTPGATDILNEGVVLTITATAIAPCATNASDDMTLSIYGVPTADAGDDATICEDGDYTLNGVATNYTTLLWSTTGDGTFDDASSLNATYFPGSDDISSGTVDLNLYAATPCGAYANDDMTLSISGLPYVSAGPDDVMCANNVYSLSGTAENYQLLLWTTSGDGSFDDITTLNTTYSPGTNDIANGSVVLTLTITPIAPCTTNVTDDMTLTIEELPTANAGSNGIVCDDASYQLSGSTQNQQSVLWTTSGDGTFDDATSNIATYTPGSTDLENSYAILTLTAYAIAPCGIDAMDDMILSIYPHPTSNAGEDATICGNESYTLSGEAENEQSVLWSTSGDGSFDDATDLEAIYTPGSIDIVNSEVILTLTVDGYPACSLAAIDEMTLTIDPLVTEVSLPDGPTFVDSYYTPTTNYTTSSEFADSYIWHINPSSAGTISVNAVTTTINWNEEFQGFAYISVTASNNCNSLTSDELEVLVDNTVGVNENYDNGIQVNVVPNPNDGLFTVNIVGVLGDIELYIYNSSGATIEHKKLMNHNATKDALDFDLNKVNRGVYYLKLINNDQVFIEKLIIN